MKKIILLSLVTIFGIQLHLNAQDKLSIGGVDFSVSIDKDKQTVTLIDHDYKINDWEYPLIKRRKFTQIVNREIEIPSAVVIGGYECIITGIGSAVFAGFGNVDTFIIPETIEFIDEYAFFGSSIKSITIPESVQSVGNRAFGACYKLKNITFTNPYITLGNGLYTESKDCSVNYTNVVKRGDNLAAQNKDSYKSQKRTSTTGPSNVDINIPTTSLKNENTFAVIIANENYHTENKVEYALNDGRIFSQYCKNVLGIPDENVHFVENATLNNMRTEVSWVRKVVEVFGEDARVIFYYAGHGIPDEATGTPYLLPVDGVGNNKETGYSIEQLYAELGKLPAKDIVVFLDACFSGSLRGEGMLASSRGVVIKSKEENPLGNMIVFSAAQGDETAYPYMEEGHGMFTYFLLKKLQEAKGNVTFGELGDYIVKNVSRRSIIINSKSQTPTVMSSPNLSSKWRNLKF